MLLWPCSKRVYGKLHESQSKDSYASSYGYDEVVVVVVVAVATTVVIIITIASGIINIYIYIYIHIINLNIIIMISIDNLGECVRISLIYFVVSLLLVILVLVRVC